MTNLEKLTENLNLKILNSSETLKLKGGTKGKGDNKPPPPPPPKPIPGGGNPPMLEAEVIIITTLF